jgi:hypothetical protein
LPKKLFSVEEELKILAGASASACAPVQELIWEKILKLTLLICKLVKG